MMGNSGKFLTRKNREEPLIRLFLQIMRRREFLLRTLGAALWGMSCSCFDVERLMASPKDHAAAGEMFGVASIPVLGLRESYLAGSRLVTQVPLGTPLRVLSQGVTSQVMTPDGTSGWVDASGFMRMEAEDVNKWNSSVQVIVLQPSCFVYEKSRRSSRKLYQLVYGSRLRFLSLHGRFYEVGFPDGKKGYMSVEDCKPLDLWRGELRNNPTNIVRSARELLGIPYLEGGALHEGVDSDGLICLIMAMHDAVVPRKAESMALKGERMDVEEDLGNLLLGDLIFFGERVEGQMVIDHVGMFSGDGRMIHCDKDGVREISLIPGEADYEPLIRSRLLYACSILPYIDVEVGLSTTQKNKLYQTDFQ